MVASRMQGRYKGTWYGVLIANDKKKPATQCQQAPYAEASKDLLDSLLGQHHESQDVLSN